MSSPFWEKLVNETPVEVRGRPSEGVWEISGRTELCNPIPNYALNVIYARLICILLTLGWYLGRVHEYSEEVENMG
tara:strand:- start:1380 stop:1607 length:228 start_codon:yes stop_codon:yes gene_type:complete